MARTSEHQFIRYMVDKFGILPDDPFYERINPYLKVWLYESWLHDKELEIDRLRQQAILIGSFFNPEMAQRMIKDRPDFQSTDLDEASAKVREKILEDITDQTRGKKKKKTRKVVD